MITKIILEGFHFLDACCPGFFIRGTVDIWARSSLLWKAISLTERCLAAPLSSKH